jgi:hypothetical protein
MHEIEGEAYFSKIDGEWIIEERTQRCCARGRNGINSEDCTDAVVEAKVFWPVSRSKAIESAISWSVFDCLIMKL